MSLNDVASKVLAAQFPEKMGFLFYPARYKVAHGGRGSSKSWSFARALVLRAAAQKTRVLCVREFQVSITESVHHLLVDQIELLGLEADFEVTQYAISCPKTGSEFIFAGIKTNFQKIKSTEGVDICWVEEADKVSENSWTLLIPTIRKDGSEIWVTFNPDEESDPTSQRFLFKRPGDAVVVEVNWMDNPWMPQVLYKEMEYLYAVDPETADHVWGGQHRKASQAQILRGKFQVRPFASPLDEGHGMPGQELALWVGPLYGLDFGFSEDPTVLSRLWVRKRELYVDREVVLKHCETADLGREILKVCPELAQGLEIMCDSARPETISHLRHVDKLNAVGAEKWAGSVEDGVSFLRSFEQIVINTSCPNAEFEAKNYKYKVCPVTGKVLRQIKDMHNHSVDGWRYALSPAIRRAETVMALEMQSQAASGHISPDVDEYEARVSSW